MASLQQPEQTLQGKMYFPLKHLPIQETKLTFTPPPPAPSLQEQPEALASPLYTH
jgi:hypothetical protein